MNQAAKSKTLIDTIFKNLPEFFKENSQHISGEVYVESDGGIHKNNIFCYVFTESYVLLFYLRCTNIP